MRRIVLAASLVLCLVAAAAAGAATLDRGFGDDGVVLTGFGPHADVRKHAARQVQVEPSGRIVLGVGGPRGTFTVERLTAAGALDASFGGDGRVTTAISARAMAVVPDGGVVVAGSTGAGNPGRDLAVTRYRPDGKVDRGFGRRGTFHLDAGLEDFAEAIALQPDGTIVVAGRSLCPAHTPGCGYYTSSTLVLLRLGPSGQLLSRTAFKLRSEAEGKAVAGDGRIVVATGSNGRSRPALLVAFTRAGKVEKRFGHRGSVELVGAPDPTTLAAAAGGGSLLAGYGPVRGNFARRLLADGSPDPSFGEGGTATCTPTRNEHDAEGQASVAPLPDGKVLLSGGHGNCALARLLPDGTLDPSFGEGGRVEASAPLGGQVEKVAAGPGETTIVVRWHTGVGFRLARYTASGALDPSFGTAGVATVPVSAETFDQVNALVPLRGGRLLAVGTRQCADYSCGEFALARYRADGELDRSFGRGGRVSTPLSGEGLATAAAIERGGDIVVGGAIGVRAYGELHETRPTLARYKPGGSLDKGFGHGGIVTVPAAKGEDVQFNGVAIAPDGDIVAVGEASCTQSGRKKCGKRYCSECGSYFVARFHRGGGLDRAFGEGGVLRIDVGRNDEDHDGGRAVAIRPDGRILIAGHSYLGGFGLVRLLPDGRRDPTFGHRGIVHTYFATTLRDSDGKRFQLEVGRPGYALTLLPGGKFLVAGGSVVPSHQGYEHPTNHGVVVRYRADGSVDPTFGHDGLTDVNGLAIRALSVDRCGRAVVAGADAVDGSPTAFGAARLLPSGALDRTFGRPTTRLRLGTGAESRANAIAVSGDRVILGGLASADGAGDEFALAALKGGRGCRR
jgi:uncharacterized delta-60 repeat protein